jgi:Flp pilus assembly protein TadD
VTRRRRLRTVIAGLGLVAVGVVAGTLLRRGAAPRLGSGAPSGTDPIPEVAAAVREGRPVIFVGLDGGDWELLDRYVEAGAMRNLARLVREGAGGVLESIHPPLSPLVWTTMMTGVSPLEHGILDFTRFNPVTGGKEPITSDERRAPAVWNMATYGKKRVAVLGLWATYPAEPVNGLMVSDRLFSFLFSEETPPPGAVYPGGREAWARGARQRAEDGVGLAEMKAYLPWLDEAEYAGLSGSADPYAHPVTALRRILVETRVYHELGTDWISRERPDLAVIYIQGTDSVGHVFASYAPPRQATVSEADYERYHRVPELYFGYVDNLLGEYRAMAEASGAVLMLASDHGFFWGEGRPTALSSFAHATAARWHRNEGLYLLWGPGIAAAPGHPHRGKVGQVCATLLSLMGLPAAKDGDAAPLPGVSPRPASPVAYRAYYKPPTPARPDRNRPEAATEALEKLKALGYVGAGEVASAPEASRRSGSTRTPGSYNNEALLLKDEGRTEEAIAAFEKAISLDPGLASALWNLSDLLFAAQRDADRSDELLVRALVRGLPEGTKYLVGRAIGYQRAGKVDRSLKLLEAASAARPDEPQVWLFCGRYRVEKGDCPGALAAFDNAVRLAAADPAAHASQGVARLCLGDRSGAKQSFLRSLELDPNQPRVREYLRRL